MNHGVPHTDVFIGDGEVAGLMRSHDWAATSLGPVDSWPEPLKIAVRILLTSKSDMWLGWGRDVNFLYNDAYRPTLGNKHPASLATPTQELWAECVVPAFDGALFSQQWRDALWDRFFTGAPPRQRRSVERYSIVKRA